MNKKRERERETKVYKSISEFFVFFSGGCDFFSGLLVDDQEQMKSSTMIISSLHIQTRLQMNKKKKISHRSIIIANCI